MRRTLLRVMLSIVCLGALAAGVWGVVWWARYPRVPDVGKVELTEAIDFIGSDDFNRMTESHRKRYTMAAIEKLREKQFKDLIALAMGSAGNPRRRKAAENVNRLSSQGDKEELGAAALRVFLDKFYELPKNERESYLTLWALAEKAGGMGGRRRAGATQPTTRPEQRFPTAEDVEQGWSRFISHQPPRTTAQMGQLMNDMRRKREALGVKSPWG
jgi:hypothetical protein